jgi:hypothetical protein
MAIPTSLNITELRFVKRPREACVPEVSPFRSVAGFEPAAGETAGEVRDASGEFRDNSRRGTRR